jgi:hypothetical protein
MKMFTDATVSSMSQSSPGFAMASNMMKDQQMNNPRGNPPPPPVETKNQGPLPGRGMQFSERPSNRPDISASRGALFREESVEMNNYAPANMQQSMPQPQPQRQEMRGPQTSDIEHILAGLKTRTVDIHAQPAPQAAAAMSVENDSMISISSLRETQNVSMPKRSQRKQRSDKNIVSLDI